MFTRDYDFSPERVKEIRIALGMTQAEFANLTGVKPNTVNAWENGRNKPKAGPVIKALLDAEDRVRVHAR